MKIKGLFVKDMILAWTQMKLFLIISLLFLILPVLVPEAGFYRGFAMLFAAMIPVSLLGFDERSNWNTYAITMPYGKKDIVLSKYALSAALLTAYTALYILLTVCASFIRTGSAGITAAFASIALFVSVGFLYDAVMLPLTFAFGTEKSRIFSVLGLAVGFGSLSAIFSAGENNLPFMAVNSAASFSAYVLPAAAILFALSGLLSIKLYRRRVR